MKVGIVGYGSIGSRHARNAVALGHETIIYDPMGPCDVKFEREVYDKADAVVIATPSAVHIAGIRACIERGRHMLVEKPIATSDQGLRELLDRAAVVYASFSRNQKLVVMVGNNLRFHPCVQQAKLQIDAGEIGQPLWASFTCAQDGQKYINEGVTLNTGAHEVDVALHLFGPAWVVSACARKIDPIAYGGDTIVDFVLEHENRVRSSFHLNSVTPIEVREFRVVGNEGDLHCDLPARTLTARLADPKLPNVTHTHNFKGIGSYDTDYLAEMRAFFDRIEGRNVPGATGEDGFSTLDILLEVRSKAGIAPR